MFNSVKKLFENDQSYLKENQLTSKDLKVIKNIVPELYFQYFIAYKSVGNFLSSKTYIFTCNALYISKNIKISFLGLLDIQKKNTSYSFIYIDKTEEYKIDQELYNYIKKIIELKNSFIKKADTLVYENNNIEQALDYYKKTFIYDFYGKNNRDALNNVGFYYWNKKRYIHALAYYQEVEKLEDWAACYNMAIIYHYGYDVKQDFKKAIYYYGKADKLKPKDKRINLQMGWAYKGLKEYNSMFTKFLIYGDNDADIQNELGLAFWNGLGVRKDLKEAYHYLQNASDKNHKYYYNIAVLCKEMKKDAMFYYYARKLDEINHYKADTILGIAYKEGIGVAIDNVKAERYLKRAVSIDENDFSALYNLAEFYKDNLRKYDLAIPLYEKAAMNSHVNSNLALAIIYNRGDYVKKDEMKAKTYFYSGVHLSNKDMYVVLAQMYIDSIFYKDDKELIESVILKGYKEAESEEEKQKILRFYFDKVYKKEIEGSGFEYIHAITYLDDLYKKDYSMSKEEYHDIKQNINLSTASRFAKEFAKEMEKLDIK